MHGSGAVLGKKRKKLLSIFRLWIFMLWFVLYWDLEKLLKLQSCWFFFVHGSAGQTCICPTGCCHLGKHLVSLGWFRAGTSGYITTPTKQIGKRITMSSAGQMGQLMTFGLWANMQAYERSLTCNLNNKSAYVWKQTIITMNRVFTHNTTCE